LLKHVIALSEWHCLDALLISGIALPMPEKGVYSWWFAVRLASGDM